MQLHPAPASTPLHEFFLPINHPPFQRLASMASIPKGGFVRASACFNQPSRLDTELYKYLYDKLEDKGWHLTQPDWQTS